MCSFNVWPLYSAKIAGYALDPRVLWKLGRAERLLTMLPVKI